MTEGWFWSTPEWAAYLEAYGKPHEEHYGPRGNLVVGLGDWRAMWSKVAKGHQADTNAAEKVMTARRTMGAADFTMYERLHRVRATAPRPQKTYDLMAASVNHGSARLYVVEDKRQVPDDLRAIFGAALFYVHEGGSYYASIATANPKPRGTDHLLVWTAMNDLAAAGVKWLDMGAVGAYGSDFKKHFGAEVRCWPNYTYLSEEKREQAERKMEDS